MSEQKRSDEGVTEFWMRRIRNDILEEAAKVIENSQETCTQDRGIDPYYHLTPRHRGNLVGLTYVAAIRALKT
jgi:hypothetical protein